MWALFVEIFKKLYEWCGHLLQAYTIGNFVMSLFFGGGVTWVASLMDWPWPLIMLSGGIAFAIGLNISNQLLWKRNAKAKFQRPKIPIVEQQNITENEGEYISLLIKKIRENANINWLFLDLIYGRKDKHPAIISDWSKGGSQQLLYTGPNTTPVEEEKK